jgi:hypothetical protein
MAAPSSLPDDPFVDPSSEAEELGGDHAFAVNSTLVVGRNASLTLGTDSLIVLGEPYNAWLRYHLLTSFGKTSPSRNGTGAIAVACGLPVRNINRAGKLGTDC